MIPLVLAVGALACAALPTLTFLRNLLHYRRLPAAVPRSAVSVLIPARDEAENIGDALRSVLASRDVDLEVVVLDDGSRDATAEIVHEVATGDARVRLETAPPLPSGWCGKQHACATLADLARHDLLVFIDADVRLEPDGLARVAAALEGGRVALLSGFPRQVTVQRLERWLLPLIHFVLLGYLPLWRMRRSKSPAYGAGCGQLMAVQRFAYRRAGGHGALRASLHDGLQLPRALRRAGFATDLFDATDIASCRMYRSDAEVRAGLAKNAHEGLAAPRTILPATVLLLWGQVLPLPLALGAWLAGSSAGVASIAAAAFVVSMLPRVVSAARFSQPPDGALAHPLAVLLLLGIQWRAFLGRLRGRPTTWRDRSYPTVEADHG